MFAELLFFFFTQKVPFNIHGPNGVLKHMKYLIETKGSAVICVAEGAGQVKAIKSFLSPL